MAKSAKTDKDKKEKEKGEKKSKADKNDKKADKGEAVMPTATPNPFPTPQIQVSCEGCSTSLSLVYCRSCDRTLCATCNQNSHLVKADANHDRVPVDDVQRYRVYCPQHKEERLLFFCQNCKIPICERCRIGSHQSIGHMIVTLENAYQAKLAIMHSLVSGKLGETRDALIAAMGNIERECSRAQAVVDNIEQETRQHMQIIIDNLHIEANRKFAFLRADQSQIVAALESMEKFSRSVMEDRRTPREFLTFVQNFDSHMTLGMSLSQQRAPDIKEISLTDLPREIQARDSILKRYATLDDLISVKDAMIWYLLRERNHDSQELKNWSAVHDRYLKALEQFKMACKYCQITLSPGSINSTCLAPGHHKHYFESILS